MKEFMTSVKGKIVAGVVTVAVVAAVIVAVLMSNRGYRVIIVNELTGTSKVTNGTGESDAYKGERLQPGDAVAVQDASDLTLGVDDDKVLYAEAGSHFAIEAVGKTGDTRTSITLSEGTNLYRIDNKLKDSESFSVETPNSTMSVRGTVFRTAVSREGSDTYTVVEVFEGVVYVEVKEESGIITGENRELRAGECAIIRSNSSQSEFVKADNGDVVHEIDYRAIPKQTAMVLGQAIDDGRTLSIGKELLFDYVQINDHVFGQAKETVAPTCEEDGYEVAVCDVCGEQGGDKIVIKATGHVPSEAETEVTDCEEGAKNIIKCSVCGKVVEEKVIEPGQHTFVEDSDATTATCTAGGTRVMVCSVCGKKTETTTKALGHDYQEVNVKAPDCTHDGLVMNKCTRCGSTTPVMTAKALGHNILESETPASCEFQGAIYGKCTRCGLMTSKSTPYLGHSYSDSDRVDPTCEIEGSVSRHCDRCGISTREGIPALGHDMYESERKSATCEDPGSIVMACYRCDKTEKNDIPAFGHDYVYKRTSSAADRMHILTCTRCNKTTGSAESCRIDPGSAVCSICGE